MQNSYQEEGAALPATGVMLEAKESQILIGRTPQLPYSLHFQPRPASDSPDLGFDILGVTRQEVAETFLKELASKEAEDQEAVKKNPRDRYSAANVFKSAANVFKKEFKAELSSYGLTLFEEYIAGLASYIPLSIDCMMRYARLKEKNVYVWKLGNNSSSTLILSQYTFYQNSYYSTVHVLIDDNGGYQGLLALNNPSLKLVSAAAHTTPVISSDTKGNMPALSEWDEAIQLAGISHFSPFKREGTPSQAIEDCTRLPREVTRIIEEYVGLTTDLDTYLKKAGVTPDNFWQAVVGFFPIYECFSYKVTGVPPLSLVSDKIRQGEVPLYLETWAAAILLYSAKQIQKTLRGEDSKEEDKHDHYDDYEGHPFFVTGNRYSGNDRQINKSYLASLETHLHKTPVLAEFLLADEDVVCVVNYYPRLQSVFVSTLLANKQFISPVIEAHMAQWMPDSMRAYQTLSSFQLLRIINRRLLHTDITLAALKTITPIQHFLHFYQLDHIEENELFFETVCLRAYEFLDPAFCTVTLQEANTNTVSIVDAAKTPADFDEKCGGYCRQEKQVPDWYCIFQYVLLGAEVGCEVLGGLSKKGHTQAIQLLLQIPEVDVNTYHGNDTCLMGAVTKGHTKTVKVFLRHPDIHVNQLCEQESNYGYGDDNSRYTALTLAVNYGHVDIVRALLETPETDVVSGYAFNTKRSYPGGDNIHEYGSLIGLAYHKKSYALVGLLFEAFSIRAMSDGKIERAFEQLPQELRNDLKFIAVAIAPDLRRFGSIALGVHINDPQIVKFLLQIPRLSGDLALKKIASQQGSYSSHKAAIFVQQLLTDTDITIDGIHAALFILLNTSRYSIDKNKKQRLADLLKLLKLLLSQPGINICYEESVKIESRDSHSYYGERREPKVEFKKVSLLSLAAKNLKYLQCLIQCPNADPSNISGDEALIAAAAHAFDSQQEKLAVIQCLLSSMQLTTVAVHTALFSILRTQDQSAETLQMLSLLFSQPDVDITTESTPPPETHRHSGRKAVKPESLLRLATEHASYLWCLADSLHLDTHQLNGDQALMTIIFSMSGSANSYRVDRNGKRMEVFDPVPKVEKLLTCTHVTLESIYKALFTLLHSGSPTAENLKMFSLLLTQSNVDLHQEDTTERYHHRDQVKDTVMSLASKKAGYLLCMDQHPSVDLQKLNGDQALANLLSNHNDESEKFTTVKQLLACTHITIEGIHKALFVLLRQEPKSPETLQILTFLLAQPGVDIHQEGAVSTKQREYDGEASHEEERAGKPVTTESLLSVASERASYLLCMARCQGVALQSLNGDRALKNAVDRKVEKLEVIQQLFAHTHITTESIHAALSILLRKVYPSTRELAIFAFLLTQPGVDIYYEVVSESRFFDYFRLQKETEETKKSVKKDSLFSLASKKAEYLLCIAEILQVDIRHLPGDQLLNNMVSLYVDGKERSGFYSLYPGSMLAEEKTEDPSENEKDSKTFNAIQQLLARTHVTVEAIHAALFKLLRKGRTNAETLKIVALLFAQPDVNIHQEDVVERPSYERRSATTPVEKETLLSLASKKAGYLLCISEGPGVDPQTVQGDKTLENSVFPSSYSSSVGDLEITLEVVQRLFASTHINLITIYDRLSAFVNRENLNMRHLKNVGLSNNDARKAESLKIVGFLLSQPDIDIHRKFLSPINDRQDFFDLPESKASTLTNEKYSFLEFVVKNPQYLPCLAKHPDIDPQIICARLEVFIQERAALIKKIVLKEKKQNTDWPQPMEEVDEEKTISNETEITVNADGDLSDRLMFFLEKAALVKPLSEGGYQLQVWMLYDFPENSMNDKGGQEQEGANETKQDPPGINEEDKEAFKIREKIAFRLFWNLKDQQSSLLDQMGLLLESPALRPEYMASLLEKAEANGLQDVVDLLRAAPCMLSAHTSSSESQAASSVEPTLPEAKEAVSSSTSAGLMQTPVPGSQLPQAPSRGIGTLFDHSQAPDSSVHPVAGMNNP